MPTFRNTLFHLHRQVDVSTHIYLCVKMEQSVPKRRHINSRRRGITQKNEIIYNFKHFCRAFREEFVVVSEEP